MNEAKRTLGVAAFCCVVSCALIAQGTAAGGSSARPTPNGNTASTVTAAPAGSPAAVAAVDETTLGIADAAAGRTATSPSPSAFSYILRMILVLGLVIAAIYGLFALLKRKSGKPGDEDAFIRVIGSAQLATGKSVQVVALGDKAWFLGVSESAVTVISELEDRELIEAMVLRAQQSPQLPKKDFAAILSGLMRHRGAADGAAPKSTDFFAKQRDRIKKF